LTLRAKCNWQFSVSFQTRVKSSHSYLIIDMHRKTVKYTTVNQSVYLITYVSSTVKE